MRFKVLYDFNDGCPVYVSPKRHNGDWPFWFAIRVIDMREHLPERELKECPRYTVELCAVSPEAAGEANLASAIESCGWEGMPALDDLVKVELLIQYGVFACLKSVSGNNLATCLKAIRHEAKCADMLFGFYMDRTENAIGNTGWDFIAGNIGFAHVA